MICVILELIAGMRVNKDGEAVAIHHEPRDDLAKHLRSERELATSPRMRTHRCVVHAADDKAKRPAGCVAQPAGVLAANAGYPE